MAKFVRNLSSALFLNRASSGVGEIPYVRAVEGRIWGIEPAPFFFTGAAFGNINHPAMLRFPFRTYRSLLVPARCSRRTVGHFPLSIHTDRALRRFLCVLRRAPLPFRLRQMSGGRLPAAFLRRSGASLSGRSFHGPYPLGPVRRPLPERGGPAGSGRQKNRTGPTVPARWFAMPCVGKAGLRSESQNVQKLREALGLPGVSAGRPYGTEPLLRGDGRPALSVSLF